MVTTFSLEDGKVLDHMKTARRNISKELENNSNCLVFATKTFIDRSNEFLFQQLNLTDWSSARKDLSEEKINVAAKMFLYLNACFTKTNSLKNYFKNLYYHAMWKHVGTYGPMQIPLKQVILSSLKIFHETSTGDNKTIAKTFQHRLNTILKGKGLKLCSFSFSSDF